MPEYHEHDQTTGAPSYDTTPQPSGGSGAVTPIALTVAWNNAHVLADPPTAIPWFTTAVDSRFGYAQYPLIDISTSVDWVVGVVFHLCTISAGVATLLDAVVSDASPVADDAAVAGVGTPGTAFFGADGLVDIPAGTVIGVVVDDGAAGPCGATAGHSVLKSLLWVAATPT